MNARALCLALLVALVLAATQPVPAQDAAADQAETLLKQGTDQYKAREFAPAKASLIKVDAAALPEADKKALEDLLAKVDDAIKKQSEAREAYANAEKALRDNDLAKAKEGFAAAAAATAFLPDAEVRDAKAQLAQVDKRLQAAGPAPVPAAAPAPTPTPVPVTSVAVTPAPTPAAAPAPAATTPAATAQTPAAADADAQRAEKARQLIAQGKAALDKNQPDVAVSYLEQALALQGGDKDAQQMLDQARSLVAKSATAVDSPLVRLEQDREVMRQAKRLDFARDMQRSRELVSGADASAAFDAAADAARAARKDIDDLRTYFTEKEYRARIGEADEQVRYVAMQKDLWERRRVSLAEKESGLKAKEMLVRQEEQRKARVAGLIARANALEEQKNYKEALDVMEQVLKLQPDNAFVLGKKDTIERSDLLRREGQNYKTTMIEWEKQSVDLREAEIPWYGWMTFPKDWRELSLRREEYSARAASETEADRAARLKLRNRIPKLDFTNLEFKDVIEFFRTASNANFHVNWAALTAAGVDRSTPVNLSLTDVTVEKALQLVLQDLSTTTRVTFIIEDGVVKVSTRDDLAKTPIVRVYDIRDLIVRVPNFAGPVIDLSSSFQNGGGNNTGGGGSNPFGGGNNGNCGAGEDNMITRTELVTQITDTITKTIDKDSWAPAGTIGSIRELGGTLVVTQTAENHSALVSLIESLRETRSLQISIEARFISVSSGFLNSIGLDVDLFFNIGSTLGGGNPGGINPPGGGPGFVTDPWTGAKVPTHGTSAWGSGKPGSNSVTPIGVIQGGGQSAIPFGNMLGVTTPVANSIGSQITSPALSIGGTFLDDVQVDFLVQATQAESSTRTLTAPRITLFNGQRAYVTVGTQQAYVAEFEPVISENAVALRPRIAFIPTGSVLDVEATVSADRRYVTMTVRPQVSTLNSITNITVGGGNIQLPNVTIQGVMTTVMVPDGGTLLLGGQRLAAEVERESGPPVLSKIPVINRFFTNRGKIRDEQTLLILIRPKIIIPREMEELAYPSK